MSKTVVITLRIDEELLANLQDCVIHHRYWKRNSIIEKAINLFVRSLSRHDQHTVLAHWEFSPKKLVCSISEEEAGTTDSKGSSSV